MRNKIDRIKQQKYQPKRANQVYCVRMDDKNVYKYIRMHRKNEHSICSVNVFCLFLKWISKKKLQIFFFEFMDQ